jgi:hypothetical protein
MRRDPGLASATGARARADPRLTTLVEQLAQPAGVLAIGLGPLLAAAQCARLDRLGQMRHRARGHQRVAREQPARVRLDRDMHLAASEVLLQRATAAGVASIRPRDHLPVYLSGASNVTCARCTSNPATIATGASYKAPALPTTRESLAHGVGRFA